MTLKISGKNFLRTASCPLYGTGTGGRYGGVTGEGVRREGYVGGGGIRKYAKRYPKIRNKIGITKKSCPHLLCGQLIC
jgi:hypothetical protein